MQDNPLDFQNHGVNNGVTVTLEPGQVPEPLSLAPCSMVAGGAFGYWRRRKQRRVAPTEAAA